MPTSPSMKVIALRQEAVLTNPGSYVASPCSPSTAICLRSAARTVPSVIAISYSRPVRLSRMLRESALAGSTVGVSVMRTTYAWSSCLDSRGPYDLGHWHRLEVRGVNLPALDSAGGPEADHSPVSG